MNFAGFPATMLYAGTSELTTDPAPTILPLPILTPFKIIERAPINTSSSISTGLCFVALGKF